MLYNEIKHIIRQFNFEGRYKSAYEIKAGNVNATYKLTYVDGENERSYVLQRINRVAFRDPDGLMENVIRVTEHIESKIDKNDPDFSRKSLHFVNTSDGGYLYCDEMGNYWRAYVYVDNVTAYDSIKDPHLFYEAGKGFGEFFAEQGADLFALQETKMQPGQADFAPEGYEQYFYSAERKG